MFLEAAFFILLACIIPTLLLVSHGKDIVKSNANERYYSFSFLRPGNPLEMLTVSTPYISYDWEDYQSAVSSYRLRSVGSANNNPWLSFSYMGILMLSMVLAGVVYSAESWKKIFGIIMVFFSTVIILAGYSPLFAPLLSTVSILKTCNHFSDCLFRIGGFHVHLVLAGLGFGTLTAAGASIAQRKNILLIYLFTTVASVVLVVLFMGKGVFSHYLFGFSVVLMVIFPVLMVLAFREPDLRKRNRIWYFLLLLMVIDTATVSFGFFRSNILMKEVVRVPDSSTQTLGSYPGAMNGFMQIRGLTSEVQNDIRKSHPVAGLYSLETNLLFPREMYQINLQSITYNSFVFSCSTPLAANFTLLDAYSPFWKVTVNGEKSELKRDLTWFKSVEIPAGTSIIRFKFKPTALHVSIMLNVLIIMGAVLVLLVFVFRSGKSIGPVSKKG